MIYGFEKGDQVNGETLGGEGLEFKNRTSSRVGRFSSDPVAFFLNKTFGIKGLVRRFNFN